MLHKILKSKRKQDAKGVHWAPYTIQKCCIVWQVYLKRQSTAYKSEKKKKIKFKKKINSTYPSLSIGLIHL